MPCYSPLRGWRSRKLLPSGKRAVVFDVAKGFADKQIDVPCGQCIGCRLERSRQWAVRCMHEAELHDENCFLTLTYDESHLPKDGSLCLRDLQLFFKRMRKRYDEKIRYFACGEYGEKLGRPHYHVCLFGFDFKDKSVVDGRKGYYQSDECRRLWPMGFNLIGAVSFASAAYVARYITKKVTGEGSVDRYLSVDDRTGEIVKEKLPEFVVMSRRPGIAREWFERYRSDVYPSDSVIVNGKEVKPPKYYDGLMEVLDKEVMNMVKGQREVGSMKVRADNDSFRLRTKEVVKKAQVTFLKRRYEDGN